jgi:hypothetical protein
MRALLRASFAAVLFSLLPVALASTALPEHSLWAVASAGYAAFVAFVVFTGARELRGGSLVRVARGERSYAVLIVSLPIVIVALNVFNLVFLRTAWPYLFSLMLGLTAAFLQFTRILRSLWRLPGGSD